MSNTATTTCRDGVKAPLAIGDVLLSDGTLIKGFIGESYGISGKTDISEFGGWRAYVTRPAAQQQQ